MFQEISQMLYSFDNFEFLRFNFINNGNAITHI